MRKRFNLTIRSRLLLEFGAAALLILAVAIVSIVNLRSLGQSLSSMAERDRLLQTGSIELRLAVEQESEAVRGYLLTGDQTFLDDLTESRTQYQTKLAQLQNLLASDPDTDLLSQADTLHSKFISIASEQSTLRDLGFGKAAVFLWQSQGNEVKTTLDNKIAEFNARQETSILEHTDQAKHQQNLTLIIALSLVLFTFITVSSGWLWTTRSITRPIERLLRATEDIGRGKFDTEVAVTGKDEFGILGNAMNRMKDELDKSRSQTQELLRQEQRRADQMRTINEVGRSISSILSLDKLLLAVTDLLEKTFNYYNVNIFLLGADAKVMILKAAQGGYKGQVPLGTEVKINEGIVGWVAKTGDTFVSKDVTKEPRYLFIKELASTRSELAVPIKIGNDVLGVLDMQSTEVNAFDQSDVFIANTLADQLAIAVHNAHLYEQAQELAAMKERQRLARDLHDAVSQTLFSASLIAEVLPRLFERNQEEGKKRIEEIRQLTKGALAEMRTLLLELRPAALIDAELSDLLKQLAESITGRARIPVNIESFGECSPPADVKVALYRIAQEALNNVAKHSGANRAEVNLICRLDRIELVISDNGKGFDMNSIQPRSLGLSIMRERAKEINASVDIESQIGQGTQVIIVWEKLVKND